MALAVAVAAIGLAALRASALVTTRPPERLLVAFTLGATLAGTEAMALGALSLGGNQLALVGAAAFTAAASLVWLRPGPSLLEVLGERARAGGWAPWAVGGAVGVLALTVVWSCRTPFLSDDGSQYHLPLIVSWLHSGEVGAAVQPYKALPVGSYPLTNEVVLAWMIGLGRSFAVTPLWTGLCLGMLGVATATGLRRLNVGAPVGALAVAAIVSMPLCVAQLNTVKNDMPALTWLAVCASLALASVQRGGPRLLAVAALAGAIAVGTKSSMLPMVLLAVFAAAWRFPEGRGTAARAVGLGVLGALPVAGVWAIRNTIEHGSPLWPMAAVPGGDPVPSFLNEYSTRFVDEPIASIRDQWRFHARNVAGGLVLLAGAPIAALAARRRAVTIGLAVTLVGVASWATGPVTGNTVFAFASFPYGTTMRYLLPGLFAAAVTIAVASRAARLQGPAGALLAAATAWNVWSCVSRGRPLFPGPVQVVVGGCLGCIVVWVLARGPSWIAGSVTRCWAPALAVVVAVSSGAALGIGTRGWLDRHATVFPNGRDAITHLVARPEYQDGDEPVRFVNLVYAELAGPSLDHDVALVPDGTPCASLEALLDDGWLFVHVRNIADSPLTPPDDPRARGCLADRDPVYDEGDFAIYAPDHLASGATAGEQ